MGRRVEPVAVVLGQCLREAVDPAQRRTEIVGNRIGQRDQFALRLAGAGLRLPPLFLRRAACEQRSACQFAPLVLREVCSAGRVRLLPNDFHNACAPHAEQRRQRNAAERPITSVDADIIKEAIG